MQQVYDRPHLQHTITALFIQKRCDTVKAAAGSPTLHELYSRKKHGIQSSVWLICRIKLFILKETLSFVCLILDWDIPNPKLKQMHNVYNEAQDMSWALGLS